MRRLKPIFAVLMMLWLLLQGFVAVAMPFCQHGSRASGAAHVADGSTNRQALGHPHHDATGLAAAHQHDTDTGAHPHHGATSAMGCNDCGGCNLACSPAVASSLELMRITGAGAFPITSLLAPPPFVPERRQRPPLPAHV